MFINGEWCGKSAVYALDSLQEAQEFLTNRIKAINQKLQKRKAKIIMLHFYFFDEIYDVTT